MARAPKKPLTVETLTHDEASRKNAPTAELEAFVPTDVKTPIQAAYERRNPDLDPQLVWRGKDMADWSALVVEAPPLYIQEKIHPKALVEDLKRAAKRRAEPEPMADLFSDFNGVAPEAKTEFYAHDQHWSNRMILGDGLKVMASLAEREGLKGQVQCIYIDPPYGIKFNSNFQWSTTSRDVKDGKADHFSREPEQVKAFRDTWRDGIHSYLTYLRDRLTVARDLLTESGSIFVQIGDENVHRVRALMDEVFGDENCIAEIVNSTTTSSSSQFIDATADYILWYGKSRDKTKYRGLLLDKAGGSSTDALYRHVRTDDGEYHRNAVGENYDEGRVFRIDQLTSQTQAATTNYTACYEGRNFPVGKRQWATPQRGMARLTKAGRVIVSGSSLAYVRFLDDYAAIPVRNIWMDTGTGSFTDPKIYVVQSGTKAIQRCILMATDPGDLVLDPTCGSGTTAYVAEQWGRRWITMDTSRVALALARARLMGARYPWYLLADSKDGQLKEAEVTRTPPSMAATHGRIRQGFVYKRVPHITLKSIANNAEIDTIWEEFQPAINQALRNLNSELIGTTISYDVSTGARAGQTIHFDADLDDEGKSEYGDEHPNPALEEWEVPRDWPVDWPEGAREWHLQFWEQRIARQKEIDASIAAKADTDTSTTSPMRTRAGCAWPVPSRSRACRPTASLPSMWTIACSMNWRLPKGAVRPAKWAGARQRTSLPWCSTT
ncbi:site-specific DNA-methyltransferase [Novosphingobium sp. YJ-S2-02]|uniref:site-specific DNA-methyltransferase (adenine-specific) n=1 Tax=Novosphingobium aureum TaxID=2792964 RepID=A0A931MLW0_9SPHN|nr:site-specific DNA-methyltransferase [Novosphingobium aureum]MBH0114368.1 site-specific DNA-methyltransferase [Novosphingobium aureum]